MKKTKIDAIRKSEVVRWCFTRSMTKNSLNDSHISNNTLSTISQTHPAETNRNKTKTAIKDMLLNYFCKKSNFGM